jgi:hypothetical protein
MPKVSIKTRKNISEAVKKSRQEHPELFPSGESHVKAVGKFTKGKYKGNITSILDVSKRTASKILKRIGLGCCVCGWNDASCDIHHINGRKVENANAHWNLTCLCPNHHRMCHNAKLEKSKLISLDKYFPDNWNELYYG